MLGICFADCWIRQNSCSLQSFVTFACAAWLLLGVAQMYLFMLLITLDVALSFRNKEVMWRK